MSNQNPKTVTFFSNVTSAQWETFSEAERLEFLTTQGVVVPLRYAPEVAPADRARKVGVVAYTVIYRGEDQSERARE